MVINTEFICFDYQTAGTIAEIKRNIETLLNTPAGTCPGDRSFGIAQDYVGMPGPVAQNQISLEIIEKIATYEPRVEVRDISARHSDGQIILTIRIGPNDAWEDTEEDEETEEENEE